MEVANAIEMNSSVSHNSLDHYYFLLNKNAERAHFLCFSWHEMGMFDLPAMINKTLETTNQEKLYYIGHSMGTTAFLVMADMRPEMNEKIKLANLVAPVAYIGHAKSPLKYLAPFVDEIDVRTIFKFYLIIFLLY